LHSVIDTLSNVFINDTQKVFVNKERFNLLMEPLIDQIENESSSSDDYVKFISEHVGPCVANMGACCVNDEAACRKLNYHLLLKTKHSSVQVRLAALDVLSLFSRKIGDVYNSYLGETVPFLAELMEGKCICYSFFFLIKPKL
jgi:U3 small nucleolar RNA-associated protein 10